MNYTGEIPELSPRRKANVQIIPLIDVVFFLLATFVLYTLMLNKLASIPVTLPVGDSGGERGQPPLVLQVTDAGLYWDKELITERELPARLAMYVKDSKHPRIMLAGDNTAKYGATTAALDEVRKAGIKEVSIETVWRATGR
ncbi:MAG: biopolymer transporter ExbD [Nibricoccus sp.]